MEKCKHQSIFLLCRLPLDWLCSIASFPLHIVSWMLALFSPLFFFLSFLVWTFLMSTVMKTNGLRAPLITHVYKCYSSRVKTFFQLRKVKLLDMKTLLLSSSLLLWGNGDGDKAWKFYWTVSLATSCYWLRFYNTSIQLNVCWISNAGLLLKRDSPFIIPEW